MGAKFDLSDDSVVVIVGSGAGGGALGRELTMQGIKVVCLEAGRRLQLSDIENDGPAMNAKMTWQDLRYGEGDVPKVNPVFSCKTVGGTTTHWTANCPRFRDFEFRSLSTYGQLAECNLADWPVTLKEMEPYYDRAEMMLGVTGTHGVPRLPESNNYKVMAAGARNIGYKDFDTYNMAINPVARDGRPGCLQTGFCSSGCFINAKWTTLFNHIPQAEATNLYDLRPECMVTQVLTDDSGKATGVRYVDKDGKSFEQKARVVCLAANVVETTRLLLHSRTARFPNGLANSSDQVGRNYMRHVMTMIFGLMPGEVHFYKGTQTAGVIRDEVKHDRTRGFSGGYQFHTLNLGPEQMAGMMKPDGWGKEYANLLRKYKNLAGVITTGEDPPQKENRITLHPTEKDKFGIPVAVVSYRLHKNTTAMIAHAQKQGAALYRSLGATDVFYATDFGATHNMGTARMGKDPATSVCNQWGQTHDIKNLFVSDGSLFVTSSSANPTLTIISLALRQAEYLGQQLRAGAV
jgi:choline dehydrogenase-like flavoprotein